MNNIEQKIKEEFDTREFMPNADSWDKLNSKLNKENKKENKKRFFYYKITAIIIGLLITFNFFINRNTSKTSIDNNDIVKIDTNKNQVIKEKGLTVKKEDIINTIINKSDKLVKIEKKQANTHPTNNNVVKKEFKNKFSSKNKKNTLKSNLNPKNETANVLAESTQKKLNKKNNLAESKFDKFTLLVQNTSENKLKTNNKIEMNSSDQDIENMLAMALGERKIETKKIVINNEEFISVIEKDLNRNKHNKILNMIKTGVDTVESIIVSNNN